MTNLELHIAGEGPVVVLLHGCPTTVDVLDGVAAQVARSARTVRVSLPGYGASRSLPRPWRLEDLHAALEDALLRRGIDRASFVGFSGGAYHALALARRGVVKSTAVVCLAGLLGLSAEERSGFLQLAAAVEGGADLRDVAAARFLSSHARTPGNVAAVQAWLVATSAANLAAEMRALADAPDLSDGVRQLDIPVLARVGSEDLASPPHKSEAIVAAARCGVLHVVPGAGHALPIEDQEGTARDVAEFLVHG